MLIAFDIGNTNIVVGCFKGKDLVLELRLKTDLGRTIDESAASLFPLFDRKLGAGWKFSAAIVSSVVPPLTPDLLRLIKDNLALDPMVVGPGIKTGIPIKISDPASVGSDRVVNAVAVKELFGTPAVVVDFGTATSFDFVGQEGAYEGGIIAPGIKIALDSLVKNTARLPHIELSFPKSVVGKSTVAAMQSGCILGYVCMVDGLIDKISQENGPLKHVVATGGIGKLISEHSARINRYEPHLTLMGLRIIAELNGYTS